ncbi:cation:proton antiporter [Phycicoccus sp. HDW14]|uniref:cation:proton antiporter n=1 Tax=Phycicoccus sp. HDW14 TaxID=2714941 RepID=UPI00353016C7
METAVLVVAIVLVVIVVSRLAAPRGVPVPIALLGVGAVLSVLPQVPEVRLSPDVVLFGLLPPLLYSAALSSSLVDIRTYRSKILSLSVGLVLFTAVGVALVVSALMDIDFALALALGAIVAPPDAVAATAVARRIGLPRKITTILEGESLLNDATALVTLRTALAAAGLAAHGAGDAAPGGISLGSVGLDLLVAVVGGVAVGVVAFLLVGWLRRRLTEVAADTALSFIAPFVAYAPAEVVGASGVLAVVTAGLLLAYRAPVLQSAPSRLAERINWSSVTFVLENAVFLLIGLQVWSLVQDTRDGELGTGRTLAVAVAVLLTVLVLRPLWLLGQAAVQVLRGRAERRAMLGWSLVSGWAGMRGVVTLAAALTLPRTRRCAPSSCSSPSSSPWGRSSSRARPSPRSPARSTSAAPTRARTPSRRPPCSARRPASGCAPSRTTPPPTARCSPSSASRPTTASTAAGSGSARSAPASARAPRRPGPACASR